MPECMSEESMPGRESYDSGKPHLEEGFSFDSTPKLQKKVILPGLAFREKQKIHFASFLLRHIVDPQIKVQI